MFDYDTAECGDALTGKYTVTASEARRWRQMFSEELEDGRSEQRLDEKNLVPVVAYFGLTPWFDAFGGHIPQGSVHTKQSLSILGEARVDVPLATELVVREKYEKRGRQVLVFEMNFRQDGFLICRTESTVLWRFAGEGVQPQSKVSEEGKSEHVLNGNPLTVDQKSTDEFAQLSGGTGRIHTDPVYGATTVFGTTIVHGMYVMALMWTALSQGDARFLSSGTTEVRFRRPVRVGEKFTLRIEPDAETNGYRMSALTGAGEAAVGVGNLPAETGAGSNDTNS